MEGIAGSMLAAVGRDDRRRDRAQPFVRSVRRNFRVLFAFVECENNTNESTTTTTSSANVRRAVGGRILSREMMRERRDAKCDESASVAR